MTIAAVAIVLDSVHKLGVVVDGMQEHIAVLKPQRVRLIALCDQLIAGTITKANAKIALDKERLIV